MQRVEKLDILMTCQSVLRFLNLCNSNGVFIRDVQIPNVILFGLFLCPMIYEFIMIIWFALQTDMEMQSKSNVLCAGVAYLQMILTYITMIRSNKFTLYTIDHMQQIVDKRCEQTPESIKIYRECEEKNAKLVKIIWKCGIAFVIVLLFVPMLFPLGYALFAYPPPKMWVLPIPSKTPFDTETYYGFIICVFIQSFGSVTWTMAFVAPLLLYMGLCSYVMAHAKDFKTIMTKLDDQLLLNSYTAKKKPINMIDMHSTLIGILKEAHETHLDLFKLLENTRKSVSGYLYFQFLFTLNYIAYVIFGLDDVTNELDFNDLMVYHILLTSICLNFTLCYYADNLTSRTCGIGDDIYNSQWFEMPTIYQKLLIIPIGRSQKIFRLTGFGIFTYSLQNFARILLRSQFTRLLMFRLTGNKSPALMLVKDITNMNL